MTRTELLQDIENNVDISTIGKSYVALTGEIRIDVVCIAEDGFTYNDCLAIEDLSLLITN